LFNFEEFGAKYFFRPLLDTFVENIGVKRFLPRLKGRLPRLNDHLPRLNCSLPRLKSDLPRLNCRLPRLTSPTLSQNAKETANTFFRPNASTHSLKTLGLAVCGMLFVAFGGSFVAVERPFVAVELWFVAVEI